MLENLVHRYRLMKDGEVLLQMTKMLKPREICLNPLGVLMKAHSLLMKMKSTLTMKLIAITIVRQNSLYLPNL